FGEGWHNNHHAYPTAAYHGHRWWEIDATGWVISAFRITGLARDVRMPKKIRVSKDTSRDGSMPISTGISPIVATVVAGDLE
ncbi:MAG: stearoyl-CoA 9-desaturase, partial [Planctomycetia bacterium]